MLDAIVQLLDPKNDFTKILTFLLIYLGLLWLMFCLWVFVDAQKRYKNFFIAVLFFALVLILNFPVLIFYLIIRPEKDEENVLYLQNGEAEALGGVNVPVVNFMGQNGVEMSLYIKINKPAETTNAQDMKVSVDWVSNNQSFKKSEQRVETSTPAMSTEEKAAFGSKFGSFLKDTTSSVSSKTKQLASSLKPKKVETETKAETKSETKTESKPAAQPESKPKETAATPEVKKEA